MQIFAQYAIACSHIIGIPNSYLMSDGSPVSVHDIVPYLAVVMLMFVLPGQAVSARLIIAALLRPRSPQTHCSFLM